MRVFRAASATAAVVLATRGPSASDRPAPAAPRGVDCQPSRRSMANILHIPGTIRNLRRYAEIIRILVAYGFGDVVQELHLDRLVDRGLRTVGRPELEQLRREERLRRAMEDLGATFIKLGQVLSTRPDLVPPEWAEEFKKLQDDAPRVPYEEIQARLEEEFPGRIGELFKKIDPEPI